VSVQQIADEALLSRATLYNYFGSKDSIMYALAAQRLHEGNKRLEQLIDAPLGPVQKLNKYIEVSFDALLKSPARNAILRQFIMQDSMRGQSYEVEYKSYYDDKRQSFERIEELPQEDQYILKLLEAIWTYEGVLFGLVQDAQDDGSIRQDHKPQELAYLIILTINGLADQISLYTTPLEKYDIAISQLRDLYLEMVNRILEPPG
jgi:AcrR family transcriptional regulator